MQRGKRLTGRREQARLQTHEVDTKFSAATASGNNFQQPQVLG